jgi:cytochrome P450
VIAGGTDTTESQLAHGLRLFAGHPDQWDRLGDDPALGPRMRHLKPDGEPVFGTPTGIYTMRSLPVRFTPHEPG